MSTVSAAIQVCITPFWDYHSTVLWCSTEPLSNGFDISYAVFSWCFSHAPWDARDSRRFQRIPPLDEHFSGLVQPNSLSSFKVTSGVYYEKLKPWATQAYPFLSWNKYLVSFGMCHIHIEKNLPQIEGLNTFVNYKGWNQVSPVICSLLKEIAIFCILFSCDSYHNWDKMDTRLPHRLSLKCIVLLGWRQFQRWTPSSFSGEEGMFIAGLPSWWILMTQKKPYQRSQ